jgi:hypothetical protein
MRPNSETQILIGLLLETYNFTTLKCTHFLLGLNLDLNRCHNLNRPGSLFASPRSGVTLLSLPRRRVIASPASYQSHTAIRCGKTIFNTVQNRPKRNDFRFFRIPTTSYQRLTTTPHQVVRFSRRCPFAVSTKMNKTSTKMNTCGGGGCSFFNGSLLSTSSEIVLLQLRVHCVHSWLPKNWNFPESEPLKIGASADSLPIRPRCTRHLRKSKSAHADLQPAISGNETGIFRKPALTP